MGKAALTDRGLKALAAKPTQKQVTKWDALLPGFGVRISAGGKLAFVVMRRPAGSPRPVRVTLGHYPAMALEDAREKAREAIAELLAGKKPTEERKRRLQQQAEADLTTFAGIAKRYVGFIRTEARTVDTISQLIDRT